MKASDPKIIASLLVKARRGDPAALQLLCRELEGFIRGYFQKRFRDPEVVNDLCQETYIRLLDNILRVRDQMKLRSFVAKVALHVCNDHLRKKYRAKRNEDLARFDEIADPAAFMHLAGESDTDVTVINRVDLEKALAHLPGKSRDILVLKSQGFNYSEISKEFGISVSGVKMQVKRSLTLLRALLFSVTFFALVTTWLLNAVEILRQR